MWKASRKKGSTFTVELELRIQEQEAMEIGVNHFMPKLFFMSTFKEAIRRVRGGLRKVEESQSDVVRGKRILVVDDIEANRIVLNKILGTLGADCDIATNGQEAVAKFEASLLEEYDLILMDVQMPVMDGYTATKAIRSSKHPLAKTVPIIAMTALWTMCGMRLNLAWTLTLRNLFRSIN